MKIFIIMLVVLININALQLKSDSPIHLKIKGSKSSIMCKRNNYVVNGIDRTCQMYSKYGYLIFEKLEAQKIINSRTAIVNIDCYYDKKKQIFRNCKKD